MAVGDASRQSTWFRDRVRDRDRVRVRVRVRVGVRVRDRLRRRRRVAVRVEVRARVDLHVRVAVDRGAAACVARVAQVLGDAAAVLARGHAVRARLPPVPDAARPRRAAGERGEPAPAVRVTWVRGRVTGRVRGRGRVRVS